MPRYLAGVNDEEGAPRYGAAGPVAGDLPRVAVVQHVPAHQRQGAERRPAYSHADADDDVHAGSAAAQRRCFS